MRPLALAVLALLAAAAPLRAQGRDPVEFRPGVQNDSRAYRLRAEQAVAEVRTRLMSAWQAGDTGALSELFRKDGVLALPGGVELRGRRAIRRSTAEVLRAASAVQLETSFQGVGAERAGEAGTVTLTLRGVDGSEATRTFTYALSLRLGYDWRWEVESLRLVEAGD
ncbi:MAG TPA: SgcJ/EcaC family oxidoreductase [Longimicrobium sp.]|nr:SgcJ/EcaC family oxidoreductase [Longimicrobium sp.]